MPTLNLAEMRKSHPDISDDWTIPQNWEHFTKDDHDVWRTLYQRQLEVLPGRACDEFMDGLEKLPLGADHIPRFDELNAALSKLTGWTVVAVPSLVPDAEFFAHLANRRFPAGNFIRRRESLDYIEEPDVFHDVFGHVPMLALPVFANYMEAYGKGGLRALSEFGALENLARLYWYTVEFGLIETPKGLRIYGSGIVSSRTESIYCLQSPSPNRIHFDLERVMRTRYRIDDFQESYFVISGFQELFGETYKDFAALYRKLATGATHLPGDVLATDRVHHRGDRSYKPHSHQAA
ncbi:MAG TPA: phenylalanine 4-monooxygenase [Micropepsaceae bacterium]|nr:phenylalanine 4-monooxygenase [Micropepsaceae bacterium]